jgi:hypothetical protein
MRRGCRYGRNVLHFPLDFAREESVSASMNTDNRTMSPEQLEPAIAEFLSAIRERLE